MLTLTYIYYVYCTIPLVFLIKKSFVLQSKCSKDTKDINVLTMIQHLFDIARVQNKKAENFLFRFPFSDYCFFKTFGKKRKTRKIWKIFFFQTKNNRNLNNVEFIYKIIIHYNFLAFPLPYFNSIAASMSLCWWFVIVNIIFVKTMCTYIVCFIYST